jgi:hypothetical protein
MSIDTHRGGEVRVFEWDDIGHKQIFEKCVNKNATKPKIVNPFDILTQKY